ncbi:MAG TPA: AbrB/MazE/SpoVT family DNA-binding domain-containing protein [Candidatus Acetothermia bacterium]|nr:AbrB/MazE/SpoVT family DNA-binding domain-containing protein [Candidatus Acetothermia bacterium]
MRIKVVRIGNSKGIRLPKPLIEQVGLVSEVDLEVRDGALVISPAQSLRAGWREAAISLAEREEDALLDAPTPTRFDTEEWEW